MAALAPLDLQDELAKVIAEILKENRYKHPLGKMVPMKVFTQNVPYDETDDDEDPIPYVIVRLHSGEDEGSKDSFYTVKVVFIIGMFDDGLEAQGYRDVMGVINKIYRRFHTNPNVNGVAVYAGAFDWMLQDDNYFPYCFGACTLDFHIPAIRREDPYA